MRLLIIFLISICIHLNYGKVFNKCALAKEMHRLGVPKSELPDWMCIAEHESSFNTKAVGKMNKNGTRDWGLFQINDKYWCKPSGGSFSYNSCKVLCNSLLSDNISAVVKCARLVKKQQGYRAWVAWNNHCQGKKPSVSECF